MTEYRLGWDAGESWEEKGRHYWCSVALLSQCQALTSNSSLPHSCWAICSGDQSHTHTCCKFHSALTWHSCQRKGGISMAAPSLLPRLSSDTDTGGYSSRNPGNSEKTFYLRNTSTPKHISHIGHCWTTVTNTAKFAFQCTVWFLNWRSFISYLKPFSSSTKLDLNVCPPSISCYHISI